MTSNTKVTLSTKLGHKETKSKTVENIFESELENYIISKKFARIIHGKT